MIRAVKVLSVSILATHAVVLLLVAAWYEILLPTWEFLKIATIYEIGLAAWLLVLVPVMLCTLAGVATDDENYYKPMLGYFLISAAAGCLWFSWSYGLQGWFNLLEIGG